MNTHKILWVLAGFAAATVAGRAGPVKPAPATSVAEWTSFVEAMAVAGATIEDQVPEKREEWIRGVSSTRLKDYRTRLAKAQAKDAVLQYRGLSQIRAVILAEPTVEALSAARTLNTAILDDIRQRIVATGFSPEAATKLKSEMFVDLSRPELWIPRYARVLNDDRVASLGLEKLGAKGQEQALVNLFRAKSERLNKAGAAEAPKQAELSRQIEDLRFRIECDTAQAGMLDMMLGFLAAGGRLDQPQSEIVAVLGKTISPEARAAAKPATLVKWADFMVKYSRGEDPWSILSEQSDPH